MPAATVTVPLISVKPRLGAPTSRKYSVFDLFPEISVCTVSLATITAFQGSELLEAFDIMPGIDISIEKGGISERIDESIFLIENRMDLDYTISIEWHGDSPETDIWDLSIPNLAKNNSLIELEILPVGNFDLERVVWITADERGIVVHLSARCSNQGC